jgi:spore germination cell wall hydrolase CwlJ-like protein
MTTALFCLATAVYFEARGEPIDGQIAVAEVVMNRVEDNRFPDSVCEVVKQNRHPGSLHRCQFSFYCDGKPETINDQQAWATAQYIAQGLLDDVLQLGIEATHYHATTVDPFWADQYINIGQIGTHRFYVSDS